MTVESFNDFNNESNEKLSDSEKVKKQYSDLCKKIGKLDNCSYIDEDWYRVTLLSKNSNTPKEYDNIPKGKGWIIVVKEDMNSWNCYITNVFYNPEYIWSENSRKVIHKRWMISWIQKSKWSHNEGWLHGSNGWTVTIDYDWETAGFENFDNLDGKDIAPILAKIYNRYLDIIIPSQKQKNQDMKIMLDRVENNIKEDDADEFLDQALENVA